MCVVREVGIEIPGRAVRAIAFATAPARQSHEGPISERFLEALRHGAAQAGLAQSYLDTLSGRYEHCGHTVAARGIRGRP